MKEESRDFEQDDTPITKQEFFGALNALEGRLVAKIGEIRGGDITPGSLTPTERNDSSDGREAKPKGRPKWFSSSSTHVEKDRDKQRNGETEKSAELERQLGELQEIHQKTLQESAKAVDDKEREIGIQKEQICQLKNEKRELAEQKLQLEEESKAREQELLSTIKRTEEAYKKQEGETQKERAAKEEANKQVDRLQREWEQAKEQIQNLRRDLEGVRSLRDRIWPSFLREVEGLAPFVEEWSNELVAERPDKDLIFMFANIFTWSCAFAIEKDGEGDDSIELTATTSLWNFSRTLLRWLYAHGKTNDEAFLIISKLSEAVNNVMQGGRYMTEVPTLDSPFSSKNMDYSADGSSVGSVAAIVAWGIRSTSSNICKKKSIVKLTN